MSTFRSGPRLRPRPPRSRWPRPHLLPLRHPATPRPSPLPPSTSRSPTGRRRSSDPPEQRSSMARAATVSPASALRLNGSGLGTLLEIGQTLSSQLELGPALERVFRKLGSDAAVLRGAVLLLDAPSRELRVEVSFGFGPEEQRA